MQLSAKYRNQFVRIMAVVLISVVVTGCASQSQTGPVASDNRRCETGTTLVCEQRLGEVVSCSCESKSGLDEIF
jgi:hypothetical protein